jgi:hypothetical protein
MIGIAVANGNSPATASGPGAESLIDRLRNPVGTPKLGKLRVSYVAWKNASTEPPTFKESDDGNDAGNR